MANIPNSSRYQTTGSNSARNGSSSHSASPSQRPHQGTGSGAYLAHQGSQDYHSPNNTGSGGTILLGLLGLAILFMFPIPALIFIAVMIIGLRLLAKK